MPMVDLPLRPETIPCDVRVRVGKKVIDVVFHLAPLSDDEYELLDAASRTTPAEEAGRVFIHYRFSCLEGGVAGVFARQVRRATVKAEEGEGYPLHIAGAPFDPANPLHIAAILPAEKQAALMGIVRYAGGLSEEDRGN